MYKLLQRLFGRYRLKAPVTPSFELRESTRQLLVKLRDARHATDILHKQVFGYRGSGKTTALVLFARELMREGQVIMVFSCYASRRHAEDLWKELYGEDSEMPTMVRYARWARGTGPRVFVLCDEPQLLDDADRRDLWLLPNLTATIESY